MAKKKKEEKRSRISSLLDSAKKGHKYEVGAGGDVLDPQMSHVRGIRLPSLGLMQMLGFSALRDSCTVLIDGPPASSKSSLAIDMFNWGLPYAAGGAIIDTENKAGFDLANGMLNDITLYLPGHLMLKSCKTLETTQRAIGDAVKYCRELNKDIDREEQIPFIIVTDSLAASPSEETKKNIKEKGHADRGHGGRVEALLWSIWLKDHETEIRDLPAISVFVNHKKEKSEKKGKLQVATAYNPGGVSQNFHATVHLRCFGGKDYISPSVDGVSWQDIYIKCAKNSRGPTGLKTCVRKCSKRLDDGSTVFWWDWAKCTADFLASLGATHPARKLLPVSKSSEVKCTCKQLKLEDVEPSVIGEAIHADRELMDSLVRECRIFMLKEFQELTREEYDALFEQAGKSKEEYLARLAASLEDNV